MADDAAVGFLEGSADGTILDSSDGAMDGTRLGSLEGTTEDCRPSIGGFVGLPVG